MSTKITGDAPAPASVDWLRRYPPIVLVVLGALLAAWLLPSALNLPQSNPNETAEYAPIPPNQNSSAPPGSLGALGLGESSTLSTEAQLGPPQQPSNNPPINPGSTFQCIQNAGGGPPRQTEDPLSPPCDENFAGDNFGSTYQGVTGSEIRVVVYLDGFGQAPNGCYQILAENEDSNGQVRPADQYTDLDYGPGQYSPQLAANNPNNASGEFIYTYLMRDLDKYFNARYQTYRRHVHMFVYYGQAGTGPNGCPTADQRTHDAEGNFSLIHPFAVVDFGGPNREAYEDYMANHGVIVFSGHHINGPNEGHHNSDFQKYPGLIWSFEPTLEELSTMYINYVCKNLVGKDATLSSQFYASPPSATTPSATPGQNLPRKFGLLESIDPNYPDLTDYANRIYQGIKACGGQFDSHIATFNRADLDVDERQDSQENTVAQQNMTTFQSDKVSTVIWAGGIEDLDTEWAQKLKYNPEWIAAPDGNLDGSVAASVQGCGEESSQPSQPSANCNQLWDNAITVTDQWRRDSSGSQVCYSAFADTDPNAAQYPPNDYRVIAICRMYTDIRELFTGIQVAGPRLTPQNINEGYHAIPKDPSNSPYSPACFYYNGEYNCVKDATLEWWDTAAVDGDGFTGCWRMYGGGTRYLNGNWPSMDPQAAKNTQTDVCNTYLY